MFQISRPVQRVLALLPGARGHLRDRLRDDEGAATAEYAIATMAAVAFAGLLVVIMQSEEVRGMLENIIRTALTLEE